VAIKFNPFTGNFDFTNDDPLTLTGLTVTGLSTLSHVHGDLAGSVYIHVKNTSNTQLPKGTPVYVTGSVGDTTTLEVAAADSSDPAKMPAIGILADTLAHNAFGHATVAGELIGLNTNLFQIGDSLYVASGGGLTLTRPTTGITQQVAIVGRVNQNSGSVTITISTELKLFTSAQPGLVPLSGGGTSNFLRADGTWAVPAGGSASPGGSTGYVQFNDGGSFGGDADLAWDKTANKLTVKGDVSLDDGGTFETVVQAVPPTGIRYITYPDESGTVALTSSVRDKSFFDATDAKPPAANFARLDTRNSVPVLEFKDTPTDESTTFIGVIPPGSDLSLGLLVRLWFFADTATSGSVRWAVEFEKMAGSDVDTNSFDVTNEVTSVTNAVSGVPEVAQVICYSTDSIVAGDVYRMRVTRKASDTTNDTMTGDAQLVAVEVRGVA
jgi:hypothetical protein